MVITRIFKLILLPKTLQNEDQLKNIQLSKSLYLNILFFKYMGHWLPLTTSKFYWLYMFYTANIIFWIVIMWNVSQFINFYFIADDLEEVAASLYVTTTTTCEIIKVYYFLKNFRDTRAVIDSLDRDIFKPDNIAEYEIVAKVLRFSQLTDISFKIIACGTVFLWATFPIFDSSSERRLPFSGWFPWDYVNSPGYELSYIYQLFGASFLGYLNITIDTLASGLMSNIMAQLDLLGYRLINIYENTELRLKEEKRLNITSGVIFQEMTNTLRKYIDHHKNIIDLANGISRVFNVSVFYQFFVSAAILCMTMFQLTLVGLFSFEMFSLIFYQLCIVMEIAMYCWFGNEVILHSERVMNAAFSSPWTDCSQQFKQNLLFFMTRLSKPLRMYAGGFFTLSVATFTLIVRSAWSYFMVLRQVHND